MVFHLAVLNLPSRYRDTWSFLAFRHVYMPHYRLRRCCSLSLFSLQLCIYFSVGWFNNIYIRFYLALTRATQVAIKRPTPALPLPTLAAMTCTISSSCHIVIRAAIVYKACSSNRQVWRRRQNLAPFNPSLVFLGFVRS
jgi:hypothetical protein